MDKIKSILVLIIVLTLTNLTPAIAQIQNRNQIDQLPPSFSWRDIDGIDFTTPIKNQAPAPTCEAYALVAAIETMMQYQTESLFEPDLSETHLYFYPGGTYEAGYVNLVDAANYLIEHGVPDEGCYPDPHRPFDYPFESLFGWEERTVKIQEWQWIDINEESIKRALIDHGPLITCMRFWQDFYYYRGGVYTHKWGNEFVGGHVMTIVGYDDAERCWIIKNSWGTDWGDDGWLKVSYDLDMWADWYGEDTGIMYIDGVYGNFMPDVPSVRIEQPQIYHTYISGLGFSTIFREIPFIQEAAPRIVGDYTIIVNAENANYVEFFLDDEFMLRDDEMPFEWNLNADSGIHTVEVLAYNEDYISMDIIDVYVLV